VLTVVAVASRWWQWHLKEWVSHDHLAQPRGRSWKADNGSRAGRDHANARLDEPEMVGYLPLPPSNIPRKAPIPVSPAEPTANPDKADHERIGTSSWARPDQSRYGGP
jgi:hypothetical protein